MLLVYTSHASRWNFGAATAATDSTAPIITPQLAGLLGLNGWYTGDVSLTWLVSDPESTISSESGCGPAPQTVVADTSGQSFTCVASSAGGNAQQTVTIKRDATKPTLATRRATSSTRRSTSPVGPRTTGNSKQGFVTAYKAAVDVLQKAGWLTAAQDTTLKTLATGL